MAFRDMPDIVIRLEKTPAFKFDQAHLVQAGNVVQIHLDFPDAYAAVIALEDIKEMWERGHIILSREVP